MGYLASRWSANRDFRCVSNWSPRAQVYHAGLLDLWLFYGGKSRRHLKVNYLYIITFEKESIKTFFSHWVQSWPTVRNDVQTMGLDNQQSGNCMLLLEPCVTNTKTDKNASRRANISASLLAWSSHGIG